MQLSELQTNVNYRRRDTTENFVSNDEIKTYLNEALDTIQAENEWEWARVSTSFSFMPSTKLPILITLAFMYLLSTSTLSMISKPAIFLGSSFMFLTTK